ncbi:MAG: PIN domain-containing protein [Corynebacterium sp.]|uniref:PIN domain-containing protein n=1 Tax=Corynebacterium sp. TaxID=1720 RepID=UPI003F9464ED
MRALLDTTVLIEGVFSYPEYDMSVSSLSYAELGLAIRATADAVERARRAEELAKVQRLMGPGLPFDDAAAEAYETVCGLVLANGRRVRGRTVDLMIAATAAVHGAIVLTRNTDDFGGLEGFVTVREP